MVMKNFINRMMSPGEQSEAMGADNNQQSDTKSENTDNEKKVEGGEQENDGDPGAESE